MPRREQGQSDKPLWHALAIEQDNAALSRGHLLTMSALLGTLIDFRQQRRILRQFTIKHDGVGEKHRVVVIVLHGPLHRRHEALVFSVKIIG